MVGGRCRGPELGQHVVELPRPGDVQHLHPCVGERRRRSGDRGIDAPGTLRAAGHQQDRPVTEAELRTGRVPDRSAIKGADLSAQRDAEDPGAAESAAGDGRCHPRGP